MLIHRNSKAILSWESLIYLLVALSTIIKTFYAIATYIYDCDFKITVCKIWFFPHNAKGNTFDNLGALMQHSKCSPCNS